MRRTALSPLAFLIVAGMLAPAAVSAMATAKVERTSDARIASGARQPDQRFASSESGAFAMGLVVTMSHLPRHTPMSKGPPKDDTFPKCPPNC